MTTLVAISDLMFLSKVDVTASQTGAKVVKVPRGGSVLDELSRSGARRLIIDLAGPFGGVETVRAIRAQHRDVEIIGYCRHTEEALIQSATDAGCTEVLTQGQLSSRLAQLLPP